ncbi:MULTISPECIES: hypothetical protein [unclassified Streptomyces]|uniref:hypothetical protein n=1 Tax=unclassified Streptomyces TaxID=2593676 RepID=UPI0011CE10F4|nr:MULTISPECIES: hypothetical protein [unclassified Streptomyces]TXS70682.1 hypothetical protein EAO69_24000 [Streptomyces sp. me109]
MLFVQGSSVTAVVRGGVGEPVIFLPGTSRPAAWDPGWTDVLKAAHVVLNATELQCLRAAMLTFGTWLPDSYVVAEGDILAVYRFR